MNKKIIVISVVTALMFSAAIYGYYIKIKKPSAIYLMQIGAYKNYENVLKNTKGIENYLVLKENDLYKVFIGIAASDETYTKLLNVFGNEYNSYKKTITLSDKNLEDKIIKYDSLINKVNTKEEIDLIVKEELKIVSNIFDETI